MVNLAALHGRQSLVARSQWVQRCNAGARPAKKGRRLRSDRRPYLDEPVGVLSWTRSSVMVKLGE
jgi:hypothetical protein